VLSRSPGRSRGAATVEFYVVALLALLPLCLGMLQMLLLLVANHQIDFAAFSAARSAATSGGDVSAMRRGFTRALTPLHLSTAGGVDRDTVLTRVSEAYTRAAAEVGLFARFEVLAPAAAARADFAVSRNGSQVIPNDALDYRATNPGARSGVSLQEANVLHLAVTYCQPLIVPFVGSMLVETLRRLDPDALHQSCYAAGRVPLRSEGVAPMQSDFIVAVR
jgi:TadE-like protein